MSDTTPATTPAPTKSILLSKTLWVQILMIALGFFPPALAWLKANPVDALAVIAAVNVLVRFATSGRVSIFPPEETEKPSGSSGGTSPLWIATLGMTAAAMGMGLPSCSLSDYPITGSLSYRDPNTGAKAGLSYAPDRMVSGGVTVPIYDAETGELLGVTDIALGKKSVVTGER